MAEIKECEHAGLDIKIVERFEKRITRLLSDMDKYDLSLFCGSGGSIRYEERKDGRQLVVGYFRGNNHDGGCGAVFLDKDGLQRGE